MWTYGITYNVPIMYKYNTNKVFQSASKAEDVFRVLLVLKLVLQLGSSVSLLVQEPLYLNNLSIVLDVAQRNFVEINQPTTTDFLSLGLGDIFVSGVMREESASILLTYWRTLRSLLRRGSTFVLDGKEYPVEEIVINLNPSKLLANFTTSYSVALL
ncbi:hypothetical protein Tco_1104946 [Tanacetum coccineum]